MSDWPEAAISCDLGAEQRPLLAVLAAKVTAVADSSTIMPVKHGRRRSRP